MPAIQVLVVATLEALAWFLAFDVMNNTGVPYCCPFPTVVIVAMVRGCPPPCVWGPERGAQSLRRSH